MIKLNKKQCLMILLYLLLWVNSAQVVVANEQDRLSLHFREAPIAVVLQALADHKQLNLVIQSEISGHLTIKLTEVSWQKALQIVTDLQQLQVELIDNVMLVTRKPSAASLRQQEQEKRQSLAEKQPLTKLVWQLRYAEPEPLALLLEEWLSPRGSVIVDEQSNTLLLKDTEAQLTELKEILQVLDKVQPQIQIAAHIVTMSQEGLKELGVSWGWEAHTEQKVSPAIQKLLIDLPVSNAAIRTGMRVARWGGRVLELELSALEQENQLDIIASPRLLTLNGQQASIKQGTEIPYEVSSGASGATAIEFKEAVLGMEVTPRTLQGGRIELTIVISQNMPGRTVKRGEGEALAIDKQEIRTQVMVNHGETLVLGGIFQQIKQQVTDKVPGLGNIPLLNYLFQRESQQHSRRELVIFITPTLVEPVNGVSVIGGDFD